MMTTAHGRVWEDGAVFIYVMLQVQSNKGHFFLSSLPSRGCTN